MTADQSPMQRIELKVRWKETWETFLDAECDGSGPHAMLAGNPPAAETRRLAVGGGAGMHLCYACYRREIAWRSDRNRSVAVPFALPAWADLRVIASEVKP